MFDPFPAEGETTFLCRGDGGKAGVIGLMQSRGRGVARFGRVGWVERSETHRLSATAVDGFRFRFNPRAYALGGRYPDGSAAVNSLCTGLVGKILPPQQAHREWLSPFRQ